MYSKDSYYTFCFCLCWRWTESPVPCGGFKKVRGIFGFDLSFWTFLLWQSAYGEAIFDERRDARS